MVYKTGQTDRTGPPIGGQMGQLYFIVNIRSYYLSKFVDLILEPADRSVPVFRHTFSVARSTNRAYATIVDKAILLRKEVK